MGLGAADKAGKERMKAVTEMAWRAILKKKKKKKKKLVGSTRCEVQKDNVKGWMGYVGRNR